jgi:hypothetical protein
MIDGRFKVDVDITDFGHIVGEVELTRTLQYANGEYGEEKQIKAFMQSYP